ncbi:dynamin-related protein 5A-like [Hibiscus syriacus]|nr:dynamin-related protein 5A-like [Hibiscus syriacus]
MHEFHCAAYSIECPPVSRERGTAEAAAEIARTAARSWLAPLLDTACDRLAVLGNLFDIALERNRSWESEYCRKAGDMDGYVGFHAALRHAYNRFIKGLAKQCKQLVKNHLDSVTSPYSQVFYENDFQGGFGSSASSYFKHNQISASSFWLELSDDGQVSHDETMRDQENILLKTMHGKPLQEKAQKLEKSSEKAK